VQATPPPQLPEFDLQDASAYQLQETLINSAALQLVLRTFNTYETYRQMNHDDRWTAADSLYFGWVPPRVWANTNIPRASIGYPLVRNQILAAIPAIVQALFSNGNEWFQAEPDIGVSPEEARMVQDTIAYILLHPKDDYGSSAQNELTLAIQFVLQYGNGFAGYEWDPVEKRVIVSSKDTRDIYVDPGLSSPYLNESRAVIERKLMTVEELIALRESNSQLNIPSDEVLNFLAQSRVQTYGDQVRSRQEAYRGINYVPGQSDHLPNPIQNFVEVLIYNSKDRIIWVLGRRVVAYNKPNPYGFIPIDSAPCTPVPGRFYADGFADLNSQNQRTIEALINARLDELSLQLHPPRAINRSAGLTPAQQKWFPGAVAGVNDAKKDIAMLEVQPSTANVFDEITFLERSSELATGVNAMGMGVPRGGNVNRTATGVQAQTQGSSSRLSQIVANIEQYMIVPMLYKIYRMIQVHIMPWDTMTARRGDQYYQVNGGVFRHKMNFRMNAASRMMTKDTLQQIFPFLMQNLTAGPFIQQLNATGQTVDWGVLSQMLQDATGTARQYPIFRPMSPEEQEAMNQPPPDVIAKQQETQSELETRKELMQMKVQGELEKAQIQKQPDPSQIEAEQMKLQMDLAMKQVEMQSKKEEAQTKAALQQFLARLKMQEKEADLRIKEIGSRQKLIADAQSTALKQAGAEAGLENQMETGRIKLEQIKQQARLKPPKKEKSKRKSE
jgi:hypothetical protein